MLPAGDPRMNWTLRLVGIGIDGQSRSYEVMAISRPDGLADIANLGLTLAEAKLLLAQVQQQVVAMQAHDHAMFRPDCQKLFVDIRRSDPRRRDASGAERGWR
jgi:hypothetical protein